MSVKLFEADMQACKIEARRIFLESSGFGRRKGSGAERMLQDAYRVFDALENGVELSAAYVHYDSVRIDGITALIGKEKLQCSAFEQINNEYIKGAYIYAVSVRGFEAPQERVSDQLYADMWGSAFTDAVRFQLRDAMKREAALSDSFGPGFYGMDVREMATLAKLLDFGTVGIEVLDGGAIMPQKACAGMYFTVTEAYEPLKQECASCQGNRSGCRFCQVRGGRQ